MKQSDAGKVAAAMLAVMLVVFLTGCLAPSPRDPGEAGTKVVADLKMSRINSFKR